MPCHNFLILKKKLLATSVFSIQHLTVRIILTQGLKVEDQFDTIERLRTNLTQGTKVEDQNGIETNKKLHASSGSVLNSMPMLQIAAPLTANPKNTFLTTQDIQFQVEVFFRNRIFIPIQWLTWVWRHVLCVNWTISPKNLESATTL